MGISSTEIVKNNVFRGQEPLFARGSFAVSVFHKPKINRVPEDRTSRVMSLTYGKDRFVAKFD